MNMANSAISINKAEHVARLLLNRIIDEDLRPGSSFGTEADLLKQFDVSRPTLREGVKILEAQGVLQLRPGPGGGILVSKPSIDTLAHMLSVYLRLNNVPFVEILRTGSPSNLTWSETRRFMGLKNISERWRKRSSDWKMPLLTTTRPSIARTANSIT